jgi:beta-glucosidase
MDELLARLTLEQKVSLLGGQDFWSLPAIGRSGCARW